MFRRRRKASDFSTEIDAHLQLESERLQQEGLSEEEARAAARRAFGNVTQAQERFYESGRWVWWDNLRQDVRYGLRRLRRSPGFTAVVVLSLALGIGANTAIFSLIDEVLVKRLPVQNPEQLVLLDTIDWRGNRDNFAHPLYERLRDHNRVLSGMLASIDVTVDVAVNGQTESRLSGELVSGNYFSVLGVRPVLGRTFTADEDKVPGGDPLVVISYEWWKQGFGGARTVLGKTITLNGTSFTIIGVTPPGFFGENVGLLPKIWVPLMMQPQVMPGKPWMNVRYVTWLNVMGRLAPGVSDQQALADLNMIYYQYLSETAGDIQDAGDRTKFLKQRIEVAPGAKGASDLRGRDSQALLILMGVVALVLLIACANVANLLLARATWRQREISVRLAMGAGRTRLIRQMVTESLLLTILSGTAGLLLASWFANVLLTLVVGGPTVSVTFFGNSRVLGFTAGLSFITAILCGLAPALRATRFDLIAALKTSSGSPNVSRTRFGLGRALVVSQVGLSLVLLIEAGLFVRSFRQLKGVDSGFDRENVLLFGFDSYAGGYHGAQLVNLAKQLQERINSIPEVRSASLAFNGPFNGGESGICCISVEGYTPHPDEDRRARFDLVMPGYFATVGIPLLLGRGFGPQDSQGAPQVAVINETMARNYFHDENPVGRRFGVGQLKSVEIIGVAKDAKYTSLREQTPRFIYLPFLQNSGLGSINSLQVRIRGNPAAAINMVSHEFKAVAKSVPILEVEPLSQRVNESLRDERTVAQLTSFFGLLALLLSCVGLYGVMAYSVSRRTNEIGVRMAMGAGQEDVLRMVLREGLVLVLIGVAIGIPAALGAARVTSSLISGLLFGLKPTDPLTIGLATTLLSGVTLLAGYLPARRATKVDPVVALRYE